jgi:hypothetical protein
MCSRDLLSFGRGKHVCGNGDGGVYGLSMRILGMRAPNLEYCKMFLGMQAWLLKKAFAG